MSTEQQHSGDIGSEEFEARGSALRTALIMAQERLREQQRAAIIIVSGVEGAGKGAVIDQLTEWMDTRGVTTSAFWNATDEERARPHQWRFWRCLPPRGQIAVLYGSWYTKPIIDRAHDQLKKSAYKAQLDRIEQLERMLVADGTLVIKLWFDLSKDEQQQRLLEDADIKIASSPLLKKFSRRYKQFRRASDFAFAHTSAAAAWNVIAAGQPRARDLAAAQVVLSALEQATGTAADETAPEVPQPATTEATDDAPTAASAPTVPAQESVPEPSSASVAPSSTSPAHGVLRPAPLARPKSYRRQLRSLQEDINALTWQAHRQQRSVVAVFEGWDAAGKGGAIRRITNGIDNRLYRVIRIAAPSDEELAHHYLWRFWRHIPMAGNFTFYDRSWYGRVLVERVEGYAQNDEWGRAFDEINAFEHSLTHAGIGLCKFWLHVDPDEQLARFEERQRTPWKQHKITDEDWRNREQRSAYEPAVEDMIARTDTRAASWQVINSNDKKSARIAVLKHYRKTLRAVLRQKQTLTGRD